VLLDEVLEVDRDEAELVPFVAAGSEAAGAYACAECGYGVTLKTVLPRCPMCGGEIWEPR
jgi:rubrerythrin